MAGLITGLILAPLLGAIVVNASRERYVRGRALAYSGFTGLLALFLWRNFDPGSAGLQMIERHAWIPAIGAEYLVGIDGLSLLLVLLTSLVIPFAFLAQRMDRHVWDGLVRAFGRLGQLFGIFTTEVDERGINAGVDETMTGTRVLGRVMSGWHSGQIQTYLGVVAIGMLALLLLYAWLA